MWHVYLRYYNFNFKTRLNVALGETLRLFLRKKKLFIRKNQNSISNTLIEKIEELEGLIELMFFQRDEYSLVNRLGLQYFFVSKFIKKSIFNSFIC